MCFDLLRARSFCDLYMVDNRMNILPSVLQLDFTFQTGIEAVRILLLQDFNKSATFANSQKSLNV